jgi:hypothetical protein
VSDSHPTSRGNASKSWRFLVQFATVASNAANYAHATQQLSNKNGILWKIGLAMTSAYKMLWLQAFISIRD